MRAAESNAQNCMNMLTCSMEQSPAWEANWFSASQEIPRTLWKPKVHYRLHKCPPPVPIVSTHVRGLLYNYFVTRDVSTVKSC